MRRLLAQCLGHDGIEIATQRARRQRGIRARECDSTGHGRRLFENRAQRVGDRRTGLGPGTYAREQLEQQKAERVDVRGGGHGPAGQLFRRGVGRRQRCGCGARVRAGVFVDQFGDTEVEQLHATFGVDQDVRRLQIPVDHQVSMRVGDGLADLREQAQALRQRRAGLRAVRRDRHTLDEFHRHIGPAVGRDAAVVEAGNAGVLQPGEDLPFDVEALELRDRFGLQQLDRCALREAAVGALGFVDLAHAAAAQVADDAPHPEA